MPAAPSPVSYKDPSWDAIEAPLEKKYGLPAGGLKAIRTRGEKSNSDQVSPVGAATVYQVMPSTAAAIKAKYGVDAFASPEGAAEASALVLRDGIRRTGTWRGSVTQYIGGTDPDKHGPVTRAYVARVMGEPAPAGGSGDDSGGYTAPAPIDPKDLLNIRPADLRDAGRPLPHTHADPYLKSPASRGRMLDEVTGGKGLLSAAPIDPTNTSGLAPTLRGEAAEIRHQADLDSYSFWDREEAIARNSSLGHIIDAVDQGYAGPADPKFHQFYVDNRAKIESVAQSDEEVDQLRQARNMVDLTQITGRITTQRERAKAIGSNGAIAGLVQQSITDFGDPLAILASAATGGVTRALGIGSVALKAAGRTGLAYASLAGENAAANVAITAGMQATGVHTTGTDYALAGITGAGIGLLLSPVHFRGVDAEAARLHVEATEKDIRARKAEFVEQAKANLGEQATPEQIAEEAARVEDKHVYEGLTGLLDEQPDDVRMLAPEPKEGTPEAEAGQAGFITRDPKVKQPIVGKYHLDTVISDDAERGVAAELIARAERFTAANPVDTKGVKTILQKVGWESAGLRMLLSDSPVMRMFSAVATEGTTGAGGRRYTAAMGQHVRERLYMRQIMRHEDLFHLFRQEQQVGKLRAFITGDIRKEFDRRVFAELEDRKGKPAGMTFDNSLSVTQAADLHERGYQLMADDQRAVGTIGAGRLDLTSRGYVPHQLSARKVAALKTPQRIAVVKLLAKQLMSEEGFDKKFSNKLAKRLLERANDKVYGSYDVPFNLHSPEGADIVRDTLEASGLSGEELQAAIGKFSRGGAQHTKQRLKLDLSADIGGGLKLRDIYNSDMVSLYRGQARRVSGEAALARYGIMGKHGLKQVRKAAQVSGATPEDLKAFDQVAAEFLNTPFGEHNHLYLDNLRLATSLSRLGGMGITQAAEYGNGVAAVGLHGTLSAVSSFGRLAKEVGQAVKGKPTSNALLKSFDEGWGYSGLDDFNHNSGLFNTADNDIPMYGTESVGIFTRSLRGAAHLQASLSGWRMITAVQTRGMAEQILAKTLRFVRSGGEDTALRDMGITPELQERLKGNLDQLATFDSKGRPKSFDVRGGDLTNHEMNTLRAAIERGASQIIQRTYIGETGKWAHDGLLKILAQFRTFSVTSVEKQWGRNVKNYGALKSGMYLLGAFSMAAPIYYARVYAHMLGMGHEEREAYAKRALAPYQVIHATMNYVSSSGLLGDVLDVGIGAYSSVTGDDAGLADFTGAGGKGAGGSRVLGGVVAPSIGLINDISSGISDLHSPSGRKKLYRAIPGANLPFVVPLLNLATPAPDAGTGF